MPAVDYRATPHSSGALEQQDALAKAHDEGLRKGIKVGFSGGQREMVARVNTLIASYENRLFVKGIRSAERYNCLLEVLEDLKNLRSLVEVKS